MFRKLFLFIVAFALLDSVVYGQGRDPKVAGEYSLDTRQHVHTVAISPDGKLLAAGNDNVHLFDLTGAEPKELRVIPTRIGFGVKALTFSPDSKYIACGGGDNKVSIWNVEDAKKVSDSKAHAADVRALAFSKDGKNLLSGSDDKSMILWNFSDGKVTESTVIRNDDKMAGSVRAVAFPLNNLTRIVSYNTEGYLRFWGANKSGKYTPLQNDKLPKAADPNLAFRPDAKAFAVSEGEAIEVVAGTAKGIYRNHTKRVSGLSFSPDGILLASCGYDGRINIWVIGGKSPTIAKERPDTLTSLAFTPPPLEGTHTVTHVATGATNGKVYVLKLEPGAPKKK